MPGRYITRRNFANCSMRILCLMYVESKDGNRVRTTKLSYKVLHRKRNAYFTYRVDSGTWFRRNNNHEDKCFLEYNSTIIKQKSRQATAIQDHGTRYSSSRHVRLTKNRDHNSCDQWLPRLLK